MDAEYFAEIAKAYREELNILYEAGLRNIQIDNPNLSYFCSEKMLAGFKKMARTQMVSSIRTSNYIMIV